MYEFHVVPGNRQIRWLYFIFLTIYEDFKLKEINFYGFYFGLPKAQLKGWYIFLKLVTLNDEGSGTTPGRRL